MDDIYAQMTQQIITELENFKPGEGAPVLPWHKTKGGMPKNALTGNMYSGANRIFLWIRTHNKDYSSDRWATYKQWKDLDIQVNKGEKATRILVPIVRKDDQDEVEFVRYIARAVFNRDQTDGPDYNEEGQVATLEDNISPHQKAENLVKASGAVIKIGGQRACYTAGGVDEITMPDKHRFTGTDTMTASEGWYSTLLHELIHWTGHGTRLKRPGINDPGRTKSVYAFEELIAEFGAAFLCQQLGLTSTLRDDHIVYIADWVQALKDQPKMLFKAASNAEKATNYLLEIKEEQVAA